jgi:hypothetical protein
MKTATLDAIGTDEVCVDCAEELVLELTEAGDAQIRCGCRCISALS